MKITKLGHSCLVVEEGSAKFLVDPGNYTTLQNDVTGLDAIFITHEHTDHCDVESLKKILLNNPQAPIYTNQGVAKVLENAGFKYQLLEDGQSVTIKNVLVEGFGKLHAVVYSTIPVVADTGYLFAGKFFTSGDSFAIPPKPVEVLALPVAGPWLKAAEFLDYALQIKPKICFPVHDGLLKALGPWAILPPIILGPAGIEYRLLEAGQSIEV